MSLKLIKNETELINFVEKYKNEFEYCLRFSLSNNYGENEIHKESLQEFFEFMYKHMRLERYFKDYVLMICEFENTKGIKKDSFIVQVSTYIKDKDGIYVYQKEPDIYITTLYNRLNIMEQSLKFPEGVLDHENKSVNEKLFKEYIGIKHLTKGIEFEIEWKTAMYNQEIKSKFKLLEYKKEFRPYYYKFILFFNKNYKDYNIQNKYDKKYLDEDIYRTYGLLKNLLDIFLNNFNDLYMMYLNHIYNNKFKNLENIFDYEKNQSEIISFIKKYIEEKSKMCVEEYSYLNDYVLCAKKILSELIIKDNKEFNKELALVFFLEQKIFELTTVENFKDYYRDEFDNLMLNKFKEKEERIEYQIDFYNLLMECTYNYADRPLKEWNIWVKGYGKFSDI